MIRLAAAVGVALCVSQATLHAQAPVFTVQAVSADVYKAPSTGSAVIGHAPRGTALPVTRELGSWVKVSWPRAEDGVGYVHVSMGSLGQSETGRPVVAARSPQPMSEAASSIPPRSGVRPPRRKACRHPWFTCRRLDTSSDLEAASAARTSASERVRARGAAIDSAFNST